MSMNEYQWSRIKCEEQIKYCSDLRQRFQQYVKQTYNTIWYSDAQDYFQKDLQVLNASLIECVCDLVNLSQLVSNETDENFILELKCEKSCNMMDKLDESNRKVYFNRRYRALINSREILLDDLSLSSIEDSHNRMLKMRAICVLDEELIHIQQVFLSKPLEEQAALRLHQIRAMINVYLKQSSFDDDDNHLSLLPLVDSCDSFLSTLRLFLSGSTSDRSLNSSSENVNE